MKPFYVIQEIAERHVLTSSDMLGKPDELTKEEFRYYLNVTKKINEIKEMEREIERKTNEVNTLINNPDYFRYNEGI